MVAKGDFRPAKEALHQSLRTCATGRGEVHKVQRGLWGVRALAAFGGVLGVVGWVYGIKVVARGGLRKLYSAPPPFLPRIKIIQVLVRGVIATPTVRRWVVKVPVERVHLRLDVRRFGPLELRCVEDTASVATGLPRGRPVGFQLRKPCRLHVAGHE